MLEDQPRSVNEIRQEQVSKKIEASFTLTHSRLLTSSFACSRDRIRPGNGGKIIEEFVQRLATFEVIEERLEWNPSSTESRSSSQDLGILDVHVLSYGGFSVPDMNHRCWLTVYRTKTNGAFVFCDHRPAWIADIDGRFCGVYGLWVMRATSIFRCCPFC